MSIQVSDIKNITPEEVSVLNKLKNEGVTIKFLQVKKFPGGAYCQEDKSLTIEIDNLCKINPGTVVHEATHYYQGKEGRLVSKQGVRIWEGVEYLNPPKTQKEYFLLPWEREAFKEKERERQVWADEQHRLIKEKYDKKFADLEEERQRILGT